MSQLVLVIANSGTGKSTSVRNFKAGEANVISCSGKELPFKHELAVKATQKYSEVQALIQAATAPVVVIDDANYLTSFDEMARISETGYQKFGFMAQNLFNVFKAIIEKQSPNQIFYILAHAAENESGQLQFKTTGKMISEKVVLEGLTNIVLTTEMTPEGEFVFRTQTNGRGVKSPLGMFEGETMPNDLREVDKAIREFYDMKPIDTPKPKQPTKEAKK